jgi:hypothetical protein
MLIRVNSRIEVTTDTIRTGMYLSPTKCHVANYSDEGMFLLGDVREGARHN